MKLKRLEIIGFKSFMDKTVISFDRDITAVVGPNGCGKSNIVDSIRWVMGEQSARHLRGKEMQDVIFAGSEGYAPLSMASVELTFSTEGYQTPADYLNHTEISICRRLYRTGESEYFINKVPVRLKDITDLFLGTGIGTKAYSIIEQDRITRMVTARPEERRFFIEEVAGISRFKARKEAALRKMESTRQNLLRLSDLMTELERQLNSLFRQAKKAEKYREVKQEFERWNLALSSGLYERLTQKQDELESRLRLAGDEEVLIKTKLTELENGLEGTRLVLSEKEEEIQQAQNNLFELTNLIGLGEAKLHHKKGERESLKMRIVALVKTMEELAREREGVAHGLSQINDQKVASELEVESLGLEVEALEEKVREAGDKIGALQLEINGNREELFAKENRLSEIRALRSGLTEKEKELVSRIEKSEKERQELKERIAQIEKVDAEAREALAGLGQLKQDLTAKTAELSEELARHQDNLKKEELELARLKEELILRKSRLASLEELQRNFEGYQEGTRTILQKKNETGGEGIFGTIADFVETEPRYEGAISAVLGEKLQYVVVKTHEEGIQAVEYLKAQAKGRTSFVPMTIRSYGAGECGDISPQEGVLGPLSQFVKLKAPLQSVAEFLFGDVVLVKDLKKALDIWTGNGHRKTLVTLDGEVVDPRGVISGGSLASTSLALLEKRREMKELAELIARLEEELAAKEKTRSVLAEGVKSLAQSLESLKTSSFEEGLRLANQEKDVEHFRKELDLLKKRLEELSMSQALDDSALQAIAPDFKNLFSEENILTADLTRLKKASESGKATLDEWQKVFDEASQGLTRKKIELAQAGERASHLERELDRLQQEAIRLRLELARLESDGFILSEKDLFIEREMAHLAKVKEKKTIRKIEKEKELAGQRQTYEELGREIREKEAEIKELRKSLEEAVNRLNQATLGLTETRGSLKHLMEQCLERHAKDLSEVYQAHLDATLDFEEAEKKVTQLRDQLAKLGEVNTGALEEYEEIKGRFDHLSQQKGDLEESLTSLERVIQKINRTTKERFQETFNQINEKFQALFPKLFKGGQARLLLTDESNLLETGVEVIAQPPGKKLQSITLLSGGEKALTAVTLVFAIFQIKPAPFCLLDEVDAPLDDANVTRYNDMIREMTPCTQFIVITHNKRTMEMADVLYGVTMQQPGISQLVSVALHQAA